MKKMRNLKLEEIKKIELNILIKFDEFCRKENLKYFLFEGSLLGAVKYKGFIPWDDDIDVCMPRKDYMLLIKKLTENPISGLKLFSIYNNSDFYYPFSKLVDTSTELKEENIREIQGYGLFIDIFPLDRIPGNNKRIEKYLRKMRILSNLFTSTQNIHIESNSKTKYALKRIMIPVLNLFGNNSIKWLDKKFAKFNDKQNDVLTKITNKEEWYLENYFKEQVELEFEGRKFFAPIEYDKILRIKFGDYEKDPPIEKQVTYHRFKAYKKDNE